MLFQFREPILLWLALVVTLLSLLVSTPPADAFTLRQAAPAIATTTQPSRRHLPRAALVGGLYMSAAEESGSEEVVSSEETPQTAAQDEEGTAQEQEEEAEPAEDPALTALKEEISALESTLKEKRRQLAYTSDQADDFTKAGYARKVAEMENMRRARSMLNSSNKSGSMAAVLREFLPILDRLLELDGAFGQDDFGKQYNALPGALKTVFTELGVKPYAAEVGQSAADKSRFVVVDSRHSNDFAADTVMEALLPGLELQGNVIRAAECVVSLGPEEVVSSEVDDTAKEQEAIADSGEETE